jgi:integrase
LFIKLLAPSLRGFGIFDITVYRLRHTYATNLFIMGVPDKERQHYLGHTTTRMTNDVYSSFTPNVKKEYNKDIFGDRYPDF